MSHYFDAVTFFNTSPALGKTIRVRLRGEGVTPLLTIEPADGHLDMGHVLEGDTVERYACFVDTGTFVPPR